MEEVKKYPSYKESGIEWLDIIPESWSLIKLKYLCQINTGSKDTQDKKDNGNYPFFVRADNIERIDEYTHNEEAVMTAGDGVGVGRVFHYYKGKFSAHQRVYVFTSFRNSDAKFIYYYLKSNLASEVLQGNAKSTVDSLRRHMLTDFFVSIPSLHEQKSIVHYLDKVISEIDSLISDKEKLIELLEEKRQAIITESVTKGLNPDVKMKDSGVDWIGEIPEHWEKNKVKYSTYVKGRIGWQGLRSDEFINEGPYLVTGTDFVNGLVNWNSCYHISEERFNEAPAIQLKENDLLITKDGTIGKVAIVKNKPEKAILNSGVFVTRCLNNQYLTEYMYWILSSKVFYKYIKYMETGSTIKHLYQETFVNFIYPLPNISEQKEIVDYINEKTNDIDSVILDSKKQIEKLKEYRQSLIYEAVTGKVDLRNYKGEEV
ncbi:restriction endonuclease subunit S [Virgibacillus salarius]